MSASSYIQIYNIEQDPIFVDTNSGRVFWTLPKKSDVKNVVYVTHIADTGQYYYEKTSNGEVSWSLPQFPKLSMDVMKAIAMDDRAACEHKARKLYDADASANQINLLDSYLDNKDGFEFDDEEETPAPTAKDADPEDDASDDGSRASMVSRGTTVSLNAAEIVKKTVVKVTKLAFLFYSTRVRF